jgi:hypothetical protein
VQRAGEVCSEVHLPKQAEAGGAEEPAEGVGATQAQATAGSAKTTTTVAILTKHTGIATTSARNRLEQVAYAGDAARFLRAANGCSEPQLHGVAYQSAAAVPLPAELDDGPGHDRLTTTVPTLFIIIAAAAKLSHGSAAIAAATACGRN